MEEILHSHAEPILRLSPACKLCRVYIRGPFSFFSRMRGIHPDPLNPPYCNRCGNPKEWPEGEHFITILFGDIREYTRLSEELRPMELQKLLNKYFSVTTKVLIQEGAVINKFIGDAVMAFFNSPYPQENHESLALRSAIRMQEAVNNLRLPFLKIGIGLHSGVALIGNIGGMESRDYTAIGDSVNVASRLQNHAGPGEIVVSKEVYEKTRSVIPSTFRVEPKSLLLKGKEQPVEAFILSSAA